MKKHDLVELALKTIRKGWTYEELCYSDDLYGREINADDIWDYVIECKEIGTIAFNEKYKEYL